MTRTLSAPLNAEQRAAIRRINAFRQRFGDGHYYLACHAALPLALTPDLLYCLWVNFQQDSHQELLDIPWIAVSDLILSNLCEEVGHELYEMDTPTRNELLKQLQYDSHFGLKRIRELADFVMAYVEQELYHPDLDTRDLAQTQNLRALAYKQPSKAAYEIALALAQLDLKDKTEWIRIATLLETLAEPLFEFKSLLLYARAIANFMRGNLQTATEQFNQATRVDDQIKVAGINLPIPKEIAIASQQEHSLEQDARARISNQYRWAIPVGAGTVLSIAILAGIFYTLRSTQSPTTNSEQTIFKIPSPISIPSSPSSTTSPPPALPSSSSSPPALPSSSPSPTQSISQPSSDQGTSSSVLRQGTIVELLDNREVYINDRKAKLKDIANAGETIRTGNRSRVGIQFNIPAGVRLDQNSSLTIGSDCVRVFRGKTLISKNKDRTGCTGTITARPKG